MSYKPSSFPFYWQVCIENNSLAELVWYSIVSNYDNSGVLIKVVLVGKTLLISMTMVCVYSKTSVIRTSCDREVFA